MIIEDIIEEIPRSFLNIIKEKFGDSTAVIVSERSRKAEGNGAFEPMLCMSTELKERVERGSYVHFSNNLRNRCLVCNEDAQNTRKEKGKMKKSQAHKDRRRLWRAGKLTCTQHDCPIAWLTLTQSDNYTDKRTTRQTRKRSYSLDGQ